MPRKSKTKTKTKAKSRGTKRKVTEQDVTKVMAKLKKIFAVKSK